MVYPQARQWVSFTLIDYASIYKDLGITFTTREELIDKIMASWADLGQDFPSEIGTGSFITGYSGNAFNAPDYSTIQKKYVGYDIADIDAEIMFGVPPREGVAAIGRFSPEAIKNTLNNQDEWPPEIKSIYSTEEYNGVTIHSWGDGFQTNLQSALKPPLLDELGRARPLAVTDKYLFSHPSLETVKQMIDASQQKGQSLADLPQYSSIANSLADLEVNSAILADDYLANLCVYSLEDDSLNLTESQKAKFIEKMGTPLKKFLTFGCSMGKDEKGIYTIIVIYHEDSGDARENVSLFKQRLETGRSIFMDKLWGDFFTETDIKAEGNVLLARLYTESRSFWISWIYSNDSLLYHED